MSSKISAGMTVWRRRCSSRKRPADGHGTPCSSWRNPVGKGPREAVIKTWSAIIPAVRRPLKKYFPPENKKLQNNLDIDPKSG
jgi:hypothetical protein